MAKFQFPFTATAATLDAIIRNSDGEAWNGSVFEAYVTANLGTYVIALTEQGTASQYYTADVPALAAGVYAVAVYRRAGGSPAEGDPIVATGPLEWTGSTFAAISSVSSQLLSDAAAAPIAANIKEINDTPVIGDGAGVPWGP